MKLLDGKKVSLEIAEELKKKVADLSFKPKLVIVRVGDRADSASYVKKKVQYGKKLGIDTEVAHFPADISQKELEQKVLEISNDDSVHGMIVQLPLPDNLDEHYVIEKIDPKKDSDGLTSDSIYKLVNGAKGPVPATPTGVITLLQKNNIEIEGKHVVVIGRSLLVGKTAALNFLKHNATVTVAHSKTKNLEEVTKSADILVVAIGKPKFVNKNHVRPGQVVVDVGISLFDERITGDVDFDEVKDIVEAISPVPGGVGPMTVVSLFDNLLRAIENE